MRATSPKKLAYGVVVFLCISIAMGLACVDPSAASGDDYSAVSTIHVTIDSLGGSPATFEARSFSLGGTNSAFPCNAAHGAPKISISSFRLNRYADEYTPLLAIGCLMGSHLRNVTIDVVVGETLILEIVLGNAVISSFQQGGSSADLGEDVSFEYGTITWQYAGGQVKGWNVCKNAPYSPPQGE
jgi:type VI protein secretion system component Hcp